MTFGNETVNINRVENDEGFESPQGKDFSYSPKYPD